MRRNGVSDPAAYVRANKAEFGDVVRRPVDRRENYVKRTVGLPGERLRIVADEIFIDGRKIAQPSEVQFNYIIPVNGPVDPQKWLDLGVRADDCGNGPVQHPYGGYRFYDVPLTAEMKKKVEAWPARWSRRSSASRRAGFTTSAVMWPLGAPLTDGRVPTWASSGFRSAARRSA